MKQYDKTEWIPEVTLVSAENLNKVEDQLKTLTDKSIELSSQLDTNMKELNNIKNVFGGLKMTSPNGDTWYLCVDNYGQLGVIKEEYK